MFPNSGRPTMQAFPTEEELLQMKEFFAAALQDPQIVQPVLPQIQWMGNPILLAQNILSNKKSELILHTTLKARDVSDKKSNLKEKIKNSKMLKTLLTTEAEFLPAWEKSGLSYDVIDSDCEMSILMVCAIMEYQQLGLQWLEKGASINLSDKTGLTPLMYACIFSNEDFVKALLNKDANVLCLDTCGKSALIHAILSDSTTIVKSLLDKNANLHVMTPDGSDALQIAATNGQIEIVELLIKKNAKLDSQDLYGWTPLMKAALNNHFNVVKVLCEEEANTDIENCEGNTAIHICAENNSLDCLKILIKHKANVNCQNKFGITPLMNASLKGHYQIVQKILKVSVATINVVDFSGRSALYFATISGNHGTILHLLSNGADTKLADKSGCTPLMQASLNGHQKVVELLMADKFEFIPLELFLALHFAVVTNRELVVKVILTKLKEPKTDQISSLDYPCRRTIPVIPLLHTAVLNKNKDIVKRLLDAGENINARDRLGQTALLVSVIQGNMEMTQFLLHHKADVNLSDDFGITPLIIASNSGHTEIVKLLLKSYASKTKSDIQGRTPLMEAACCGQLELFKLLYELNSNLDAVDTEGWTALMLAAQFGHNEIMTFLLEKDASHLKRSRGGATALIIAAGNGKLAAVKELIKFKASVDESDLNGFTPLLLAAARGYKDIVDILIKNRACVNAQENTALSSPLLFSVQRGDTLMVESLLKAKAEVNIVNKDGYSPLHIACMGGYQKIVQMLVEALAEIDKRDSLNRTPLMYAAFKGDTDIVQYLLEKKANSNLCDSRGWTPLMLCAQRGLTACMEIFLKKKVNIEAKESLQGYTALGISAANCHRDAVCLLLSKGANPNAKNKLGQTPLMLSAIRGHLEIVKSLINNENPRPDLNIRELGQNKTALIYAVESNKVAVVKALLEAGADANIKTKSRQTALHISAMYGNKDVVFALKKANLEIADINGNTPLLVCASYSTYWVMKTLLDCGANATHKNKDDDTALTISIQKKCFKAVRLLLSKIQPSEEDKLILIKLAKKSGTKEIEDIIRSFKKQEVSADEDGGSAASGGIYEESQIIEDISSNKCDPIMESPTKIENVENIYLTSENHKYSFAGANIQNVYMNVNNQTIVQKTKNLAINEGCHNMTNTNTVEQARNVAINSSSIHDNYADNSK